MDPALQAFAQGLPIFLAQGAVALVIWGAGLTLYVILTPHAEITLIRQGNHAAGMSMGAAAVGIAIPIAATLSTSHSMLDLLIWGGTALVLQLLAFRGVDLLVRDLSKRISDGEIAAATMLAGVKLGAALITASAL